MIDFYADEKNKDCFILDLDNKTKESLAILECLQLVYDILEEIENVNNINLVDLNNTNANTILTLQYNLLSNIKRTTEKLKEQMEYERFDEEK